MRRAAGLGATIAATATVAVGVMALMGATRIPVGEYLLFPGSMAAWLAKGDNFGSSREFLASAIALGVPINALAGAILGMLLTVLRGRSKEESSGGPPGRQEDAASMKEPDT